MIIDDFMLFSIWIIKQAAYILTC
uniref:Uncharacterized protein n=1 Tax=Arundo donax TaxID=35708 RepID=A0A0A9AJL8_ARUDO